MTDLAAIYEQLTRPRTAQELQGAYRVALGRGASDVAPGELADRALPLLATAVPRLISLAVATYALHVLPQHRRTTNEIADELCETVNRTAVGSLYRADLALAADAREGEYSPSDSLLIVYEQSARALRQASLQPDPPSIVEHAQQAGRWAAIAIEALDQRRPAASEAIIDCLADLLCVCVFADTLATRLPTGAPVTHARGQETLDA